MLSFELVILCFKLSYFVLDEHVTNHVFVFVHMHSFSVLWSLIQISHTKHSASKKPTSNGARTDSNNFKSVEVDMKYNDCYKRATIIMERVVKLETLEETFIPEVFKKGLGPSC